MVVAVSTPAAVEHVGDRRAALAEGLLVAALETIRREGLANSPARRRAALELADAAGDLDRLSRGDASECPDCGRDSCSGDCVPPPSPPLLVLPAATVAKAPPPRWIIDGFAVENGVHLLVSESGTGKTFVLLNLAAHLACGAEWFGLSTSAGSVVYVGLEADALSLRLQAIEEQGFDLANVYVIRATDPISPTIGRDGRETPSVGEAALTTALRELAESLARDGRPPIVALMVDTVRASMAGSEDSSSDASSYLRAVRRILRVIEGAAAILAHHSGWQDGDVKRKRERGSSAFRGNVDGVAYLEADDEAAADPSLVPLVLRVLKARDAQRPEHVRLVRQRVDLPGFDRRGEPLSSCIIVADSRSASDRESATSAALLAEEHRLDVKVLQMVRDYPKSTSREDIRKLVRAGKPAVAASVTRLVLRELLIEGRRGSPFTLTTAGLRAANGGDL